MIRNPYAKFLSLLPKQSKWIGQVTGRIDEGHVYVKQVGNRAVNLICECDSDVAENTYVLLTDRTVTTILTNASTVLEVELIA